jgi:hypothetical protein
MLATLPAWLFLPLAFAPMSVVWYCHARLAHFRRSPGNHPRFVTWRSLRPDLYTDGGYLWVRRLWIAAVVMIPWIVLVALLFRME